MRPSWNQYFMEIAKVAKKRSTCLRRQVGAVIVKDNRILATGYNGVPAGIRHCSEVGCLRESLNVPSGERHEICRGVHAEQNAILQAAYHGVAVFGSVLYCTASPCSICAKMIVNAGIKKVIFEEVYSDKMALDILSEGNVEIFQTSESTQLDFEYKFDDL